MSETSGGVEMAYAGAGVPDADLAHLAQLEHLLARHNLRLAFERNAQTGHPVMRLVDASSGEPRPRIPTAVSRRVADLAASLAARPARRRRSA